MKKLSSKMKFLLVLAICAAIMVPAVASAGKTLRLDEDYGPGKYEVQIPLTSKTTELVFKLTNGDGAGDNVVSSVKIALLDENGKVKEVIFSPNDFNQQNFSNAVNSLSQALVGTATNINVSIKVGGPKNCGIHLAVTEHWNGWIPPSGTPAWPH